MISWSHVGKKKNYHTPELPLKLPSEQLSFENDASRIDTGLGCSLPPAKYAAAISGWIFS